MAGEVTNIGNMGLGMQPSKKRVVYGEDRLKFYYHSI